MSENPFADPTGDPRSEAPVTANFATKPTPGALQVIAILCLIFGIMGLFASCMGGAGLAAMPWLKGLFENAPVTADSEFQKINMQVATSPLMMISNIVLIIANFVVAPILIMGSIGVLRKKESGRTMLRLGLMLAIVYNLVKAVISIVAQVMMANAFAATIDAYEGPVAKEKIEALYQMTRMIGIGGAIVGAIFALALLGFYIWSRGYLNREDVVEYFAAFSTKR